MFILIIYLVSLADRVSVDSSYTEIIQPHGYEFDLADLLGLGEHYHERLKSPPSLRNSASKFLLEVYNDIAENESDLDHVREHLAQGHRQRRALRETNFITSFDRMEIANCNNIITFSSKDLRNFTKSLIAGIPISSDMQMSFNTHDVPRDLQLVHAVLRIYQQPIFGKYAESTDNQTATITIYEKKTGLTNALTTLSSINTTISHKGWLEFNMTLIFNRWLKEQFYQPPRNNELIVGVTLYTHDVAQETRAQEILASDFGLVKPDMSQEMLELSPFVIGYFNGPDLMAKIQKIRFKRDVSKQKHTKSDIQMPVQSAAILQEIYRLPKICERLNFTLNFHELQMHNWVIAPRKFEAYFCGGECNFPLGSKMNATNHAIVQTLMHLKQSHLPKPSCVPTVLGSISVLHYLNEDSVNLSKYPQSVAKECGCH